MTNFKFKFKKRNGDWTIITVDDNGVMHVPETSFRNANTTSLIRSFIELLIHENWTNAEVEEE